LSLAVQHVQPPRIPTAIPLAIPHPLPEAFSPRLSSSGLSTPPASTHLRSNFNYALAHQKLLLASPRLSDTDEGELEGAMAGDAVTLPQPFPERANELKFVASTGVVFLGSSAVVLDLIKLTEPTKRNISAVEGKQETNEVETQALQKFELSYLPLRTGFLTVGGLRILLLEDKVVSVAADNDVAEEKDEDAGGRREARTLKEWDIIGEIWVST